MNGVVPARHGHPAVICSWDTDGAVQTAEPMDKKRERSLFGSSISHLSPADAIAKMPWPFHQRKPSDVPSTPATSHFSNFSHFRDFTHFKEIGRAEQTRSWFKTSDDASSTISKSLVPDYVVNYIRGETPESLARKREQIRGGKRDVVITPQREKFMSQQAFFDDDPFSSKTHLTLNPYAGDPRKQGSQSLLGGWRGGLMAHATLSLIILLTAIVGVVVAATRAHMTLGEATMFSGSCTVASNLNTGLHVLINIFTTVILAGGNYVFQVLSSPTRTEVAAAHDKRHWLDIGIPSVRNLRRISGIRTSLATVLVIAAVATHVIYNAVIYTTQSGADYDVVFITEPFLNGGSFSNETEYNSAGLSRSELLNLQYDAVQSKLVNLTAESCKRQFGGAFETAYDAVLLVVDSSTSTTSLVQTERSKPSPKASRSLSARGDITLDGSLVKYCLARENSSPTCDVMVSLPLLGTVGFFNLVTLISVAVILTRPNFNPLATLGDAIRSFLRFADSTTEGNCFLSKSDVAKGAWGYGEARQFTPRSHLWFYTPSLSRWLLTIISWFIIAAPTAATFALLMLSDPQGLLTPFGTATPYTTFLLSVPLKSVQAAILASAPQVLLAILYITINAHLTTYYLSHELSLFAAGPRPLRVSSEPVGVQTSSLYLTLPRPVSWMLFVIFVAAGFVLSQAVFPAVITLTTSMSEAGSIVGIAFSTEALLVLLALLVVVLLVVLAFGLRRAPTAPLANGDEKGNPMTLPGGSCSAVLSARCHAVMDEFEPWKETLTWGVVAEPLGAQEGRCGFSAQAVGAVDSSRLYA